MISILKPEAEMDPASKKRIARILILFIPCMACAALLILAFFVMKAPPRWLLTVALAVSLLGQIFGAKIYSLRKLRRN